MRRMHRPGLSSAAARTSMMRWLVHVPRRRTSPAAGWASLVLWRKSGRHVPREAAMACGMGCHGLTPTAGRATAAWNRPVLGALGLPQPGPDRVLEARIRRGPSLLWRGDVSRAQSNEHAQDANDHHRHAKPVVLVWPRLSLQAPATCEECERKLGMRIRDRLLAVG